MNTLIAIKNINAVKKLTLSLKWMLYQRHQLANLVCRT